MQPNPNLNRDREGKTELGQVKYRLLFLRSHQTHQVIDDLREAEHRECRVLFSLNELLN